MSNWDFKREEWDFETIPVGTHRVRIESVDQAISKSGNDMLTIELSVSNYRPHLWYYIVFLVDKPEITNRNLTQFFDSFGIEDGDFNTKNWIGKVGAVVTKIEEYDGKESAKVNYFVRKSKQDGLPPFVDKSAGDGDAKPVLTPSEDDLPF